MKFDPALLEKIFLLIRNKTQIDISGYKLTTIGRRIERQMRLLKFEKLHEFAEHLETSPESVQALCDDVFIHVTEFFRDSESFEALQKQTFARFIDNRIAGKPIRIWVPGCSTGEEAYSIGMSLLDFLASKRKKTPLQIFGTDISEKAVEKARLGLYKESDMTGVSGARLKKYFERAKGGLKVKKVLRDACVFSQHDLINNPPFAKIDLISCRNVLIYFDPELQKRVLPIFHYSLGSDGILWLGRSEAPTGISKFFTLVDKNHKIFRKLDVPTPLGFRFPRARAIENLKKSSNPFVSARGSHREIDRIALARYAPAAVVVNDEMEIVEVRGHTSPFLELPSGQISHSLLKMLRPELLPGVRQTIQNAKKTNRPARRDALSYGESGARDHVDIEVVPIKPSAGQKGRHFLIFFEKLKRGEKKREVTKRTEKPKSRKSDPKDDYITELLQQIDSMREHQQLLAEGYETAQEELTSSNEELQSTLEEFQSTNEELETAKEELQATNEELATVNDELQIRNEELAKSEERFRLLVSGVKDYAIFMLDPGGNITSWNEGARRMKGYEEHEIIGRHFSVFYLPDDLEREHPQHELEHAKKHGRYEEEGWRLRKDGTKFWANVVITRVNRADGELFGFSKVTRDLTERKRAEEHLQIARRAAEKQEQLQRSKDTLEEIFNQSSSFMTLTVGPDHVFERANNAYFDFLQLDNSIIGQRVRDVLPEIESQGFITRLDEAFKSGKPFRAVEMPLKLRTKTGGERLLYADFVYQPIRNADGEVFGLVHMGTNVTEKVLAKQKLVDAIKIRDDFLAIASHELKTPLTNLKLQLQVSEQIFKAEEPSRAQVLETLAVSIRQVNSLSSIVDDLLEVSRIQTKKFSIARSRFPLADVVRETIERFNEQLKAVNSHVSQSLDDSVIGSWDRNRIEQVIANLISNAIKYAPDSPLHVTVRREGNMAILLIEDSGPGIPKDKQATIFNIFERLVTQKYVGGMGIGLYIVKEIAEAHGGSVGLESEPGKGSKFSVKLPC